MKSEPSYLITKHLEQYHLDKNEVCSSGGGAVGERGYQYPISMNVFQMTFFFGDNMKKHSRF